MDLYNRYTHIEDVLIPLHSGQWFTWSDTKNKCYETLVVIDGKYPKPSKESLETELEILKAADDSQEYARNRKVEYDALNQFEMQYDDEVNSTTTWKDAIAAIKAKYPKPE